MRPSVYVDDNAIITSTPRGTPRAATPALLDAVEGPTCRASPQQDRTAAALLTSVGTTRAARRAPLFATAAPMARRGVLQAAANQFRDPMATPAMPLGPVPTQSSWMDCRHGSSASSCNAGNRCQLNMRGSIQRVAASTLTGRDFDVRHRIQASANRHTRIVDVADRQRRTFSQDTSPNCLLEHDLGRVFRRHGGR